MVAKRGKLVLKDQDMTAAKAKDVKGGIIAILVGMLKPGTAQTHGAGGGGGAGKVAMQDFHFVMK